MPQHDPLALFYSEMQEAFQKAITADCEKHEFSIDVAGHQINLLLAGNGLYPIISQSLAHITTKESKTPDWEIFIWDERSTGISLPTVPWDLAAIEGDTTLVFPAHARHKISLTNERDILTITDELANKTFIWIKDSKEIFTHHYAAPLLHHLKNLVTRFGMAIVHAACVGDATGAVLLVGKGGSGKSTTALLSAVSGLNYLSDDYCLVKFGVEPTAWCLYSSGKLHHHHLKRFPALFQVAVNPVPDVYEKPIVFMHRHFKGRVVTKGALKAIIAPVVTGQAETKLTAVSKAEIFKALALSTIFQLNTDDPALLKKMSGLVGQLPGYRLELGIDTDQIPVVIKNLLTKLGDEDLALER